MSFDTFEQLTYDDIVDLIPNRAEAWLLANQKFASGDHWQGGTGWVGPMLADDHPNVSDARDYVKKIFAPEDIITEIMDRHAGGVLGRPPRWSFATGDPDSEASQQLRADLDWWLRERRVQTVLTKAVKTSLWANRGTLRLYIPAGQRENGLVPEGTFRETLERIWIEHVPPTQAAVAEDKSSKQPIGIYTYEEELPDKSTERRAELIYTAPDGRTIIRTIRDDGTAVDEPLLIDIGKRLMMFELQRPLMIDEPMRRAQTKVNHASTAENANLAVGGFIARLFFNAEMPGTWEIDAITGERKFTPSPLHLGPGTANFLVGITTRGMDGSEQVATPTYKREEPVNPESFIKTKTATKAFMLGRAKQRFVIMDEDATASGASRIQARQDYEASLTETKAEVDNALEWLLETVIALATALSQEKSFAGMMIVADTLIDSGVLTPDEMRVASELHKSGLLSQQTAMSRIGLDDIEAELKRIDDEREDDNDAAASPGNQDE